MKMLIRIWHNWQAKRAQQSAEKTKNEAFFRAHRPQPDPDIPAWVMTGPDNPGVKSSRITHVHDVALPKTA